MSSDPASVVYAVLTVVPLVLLGFLLVPFVWRRGVRFFAVPDREQKLVLGLFAFSLVVAVFGIRKLEFGLFMAFCGLVVLLQSAGPKWWYRDRVWGAYLVPLKVKRWRLDGETYHLVLSAGGRLTVKNEPQNRAFLDALALSPPGDPDAEASS